MTTDHNCDGCGDECDCLFLDGRCHGCWNCHGHWVGGVQNRRRRFTFGVKPFTIAPLTLPIDFEALMSAEYAPCVTANGTQWEPHVANGGRSRSDRSVKALKNYIRWQGLPDDFLADAPFTVAEKVRVVGNGVPLPMGRAVARAVKRAIYESSQSVDAVGLSQELPIVDTRDYRFKL